MNYQIELAARDAYEQIKAGGMTGREAIGQFKAALVSAALVDNCGNQSMASRKLNLNRTTIRNHAKGVRK